MMQRTLTVALFLRFWISPFAEICPGQAEEPKPPPAFSVVTPNSKSAEELIFDDILAKYENLSYEQFRADLKPRTYVEKLSFDPTSVKYFEQATAKLQLNEQEQEIFKRHGFVSVDRGQRYSFGSAYYA